MSVSSKGFSLLTAMMLVLLLSSMILFLHLGVVAQWRMAANVEDQLYSLVLAENGIEYARTLLPHVAMTPLLVGVDGTLCEEHQEQWRSPMAFAEAQRIDPSGWTTGCDDGLAAYDGRLLLPEGYRANEGYFFLRFSNNSEESPDLDEDQIVLVRSLGIVPARVQDPFFPGVRNNVALIEARFRQERAFSLSSALTLFADSGDFLWQGETFLVEGDQNYGIGVIQVSDSNTPIYEDLAASFSLEQQERIRGKGINPSIRDLSPDYLTELTYRRLFRSEFWNHFLRQLPDFVDTQQGGIAYFDQGGSLDRSLSGMVFVQGEFTLRAGATVRGVLVHLGGGRLILEDDAEVVGGVWMSNLDTSGEEAISRPIALQVSGSAGIYFDRAAVQTALGFLPPTRLGWRVLFPETVR